MENAFSYDVVLLTESRYDQPREINWYIRQVLTEDALVADALRKKGLRVARKDWADPVFDWSSTRLALFRTTWDYFHRFSAFREWLERAGQQTEFINPLSLVRWNMDKHYLLELEAKGVRIPPTRYLRPGHRQSLAETCAEQGWGEVILKPAVSGGGRHTYRIGERERDRYEPIYLQLLEEESLLVQPFQESVPLLGEVALMVIGGQFSHAVLKKAKAGDFRVQDDFGGTVHPYEAGPEAIAFAESVVQACDPLPVYARVDLIRDNDGQWALVELELIEPEMWFRYHEPAADALAGIIFEEWF